MSSPTVIPTDLITPLGAYIRLRERGRGSVPARVGGERPARAALVRRSGRARRSRSRRRSGRTRRSSATSAYDHVATLEPTVPLPPDGPDLPESRFVVADTLIRFDHARGLAEVVCGDPDELRARLDAPTPPIPRGPRERRADQAVPRPLGLRALRRAGEGAHPCRRRLPDRRLPAGGATDLGERDRPLPRAPPRQSLAVSLPPRARRGRPDRLVAGDARQGERTAREPEPDRRHDAARAGRRGALLESEKDRAEHVMLVDLGRNDLSRVCSQGTVQRRALHGAGALLARHAPRLRGGRRAPRGRAPVRPAARMLPGRDGLGRAEGPRDADHLRARGLPARPVRRRGRLRAAERRHGHLHRDPDDRPPRGSRIPPGGRRDRRRLGAARRARGVPAQAGRARERDYPGGAER